MEEINLDEHIKFNTPFYNYKNKWVCYLSYSKKRKHEIYIGFVKGHTIEYEGLVSEGRKQIKIYRINPDIDINVKALREITVLLKTEYA